MSLKPAFPIEQFTPDAHECCHYTDGIQTALMKAETSVQLTNACLAMSSVDPGWEKSPLIGSHVHVVLEVHLQI